MLTLIALFLGCYYILAMFLDAIVLEASAVCALLFLIMIGCGALAIVANQKRAWTPAIISLLGTVAIQLLAQHVAMVEIVFAVILAIIATYRIKREIAGYIRRDAARPGGPMLQPWMTTLLRFI